MKKIYELKNERAQKVAAAHELLAKKDMEAWNAAMVEIKAMNAEIEALEAMDAELGRFDDGNAEMLALREKQEKEKRDASIARTMDAVRGTNEYIRAWGTAMRMGADVNRNIEAAQYRPLYDAMTIGGGNPTGTDGGFLVPVEFDNLIHKKMKEFVRLADFFNVETVTGYSGWRAVETTASRKPLPLVEEGANIPKDSQPSFKRVNYTIKKYGDRIAISGELLQDNTAGLMAYLAEWFAPRVVLTENALLLGLLNALTAKSFTAGKEFAELKSALNKDLNTALSRNAVLLCNQNSYDFFDGLNDANGRPLLVPVPTDPDVYRLKGRPITVADNDLLPTRTVTTSGATKGDYDPMYIGYFKAFGTLFRRQALEFATTNIGGDAWGTAGNEVRGIVRMDAQAVDEGAAVKREVFTPAT